jgi:hypothetical protein
MAVDNTLFIPRSDTYFGSKLPREGRYYARYSQAESNNEEGDERRISLFFEAFDASWFDHYQGTLDSREKWTFYSRAPLALLEIRVDSARIPEFVAYLDQPQGAEIPWVEMYFGSSTQGLRIYHYANLFQEPATRSYEKISRVDDERARRLEATVNLDHLPDATEAEIDSALVTLAAREIPYSVAFDVGQGNAIGLFGDDNFVQAYFDLGGGAGAHAFTFPKLLKAFCFTKKPPIVLSHWDHDHWSSAYRSPEAFGSTWIAPRQSIGPIQAAVIAQITLAGRLLLVPSLFPGKWRGSVLLERCTGSDRNNGGIALTISESPNGAGWQMLFPGDARYRFVPSYIAGKIYHSVVAPHHGAKPDKTPVPVFTGHPASRMVYSYGHGNSYKHATLTARRAHHANGWIDPAILPGTPISYVRNTEDRSIAGLGHVLLSWRTTSGPPRLPCHGSHCQLQAVQC